MAGYGQHITLSLPSGNKVKVRRGSILSLVSSGQMPSHLIGAVWQAFGQGTTPTPAEIAADPERVGMMVSVMHAAIRAVLVQPTLTDGPSENSVDAEGFTVGKVNIDDIPDPDKVVLFGFCQGVLRGQEEEERASGGSLETFPAGTDGQAAGPSSEEVRPPAEQPAPAAA